MIIEWDDGDSGDILRLGQEPLRFRIHSMDTPETGGVGAAIGGSECEQERQLGKTAKAWASARTDGSTIF